MHHIYGYYAAADVQVSPVTITTCVFIEVDTPLKLIDLVGMAMIT
jgi:hypothetical protein